MTRIFIEDQELDITKDFSQQITYAVDDLTNTDSKATSFSKTIVLPGTANNNRLFGNIFEFGNSNFGSPSSQSVGYGFNASKSAKARLEINGLQVMKGVLRLLEIIRDGDYVEYEVALFGELGGFFSALGARKIEQLDFSEYNHTYSEANIVSSWISASLGFSYYYPLIDYGNVSPADNPSFAKKNFYFTAFRPAFFVRQYLDKIIKNAGYTWSSNFMNTDFFKRLIIPNNQVRLSFIKSQIFYGQTQALGSIVLVDKNDVKQVDIVNTIQSNFTTTDNKVFTYTGAQTFRGKAQINLNGFWRFIAQDNIIRSRLVNFKIRINGVTVSEGDSIQMVIGGSARPYARTYFNINHTSPNVGEIVLNTNDTIELAVSNVEGTTDEPPIDIWVLSGWIQLVGAPIYSPATYGDFISVNETLPKGILQKDFFSSILKMFNLMVKEDKEIEKHLIIEPYIDFYDTNRTSYLDWSDKLDRSKPIKIKPMSELNARFYEFKYKQDNDFLNEEYRKKYNENYGDRVYDNQFEFTKDTDKTEVIFSSTPLISYSGGDKTFPAIYKKNNNAEEMIEHNIRIMLAKRITGRAGWRIKNSDGSNLGTSDLTSYGYAGHLNDPITPTADLNFGAPKEVKFTLTNPYPNANLFNAYYSPYLGEISDKDSRLVTCKMWLTEKDVFNLDFGRFIWLDGVLYRLIKVVDYTEGEVCEVQLLRAINTTY